MNGTDGSADHDGVAAKSSLVGGGVLLVGMVLSDWASALRAAMLLGILVGGIIVIAVACPWVTAISAGGGLVALARRLR